MPKLEINSRPVEVPSGTNLIEAAKLLNIEIPHFCFHPGLTTVGSCRICQVEVEQNGRRSLVVACNTPAADGMKVHIDTDVVKNARRAVLEFYLQHHPLDCPVCDDAGECDLQNYYMKHGLHDSRVELTDKKHKHKVHDVGPTVVLDSERCVLCSRCVRFCREIVGSDELGIFGQGGDAELMNVPGRKLVNDYAGNVVDLCPVGALTDKDFRFKRRVWYLSRTPSICTGCSRGCNIYIDWDSKHTFKDPGRRIQRLKPRYNRMVNEWWICDRGRYGFHNVDSPNRLLSPMSRIETGESGLTSFDRIIRRAAERIQAALKKSGPKSIAVIGSAKSSNEDLFVLKRLFADELKVQSLDVALAEEPKGKEDEILMRADLSPNRRGALELGVKPWGGGGLSGDDILEAAAEGDFEVLIVVEHDISHSLDKRELDRLKQHGEYILFLGTTACATSQIAHDVLPVAAWVEREGSFTNFQGRVQKTSRALEPLGEAIPEWRIWTRVAAELGQAVHYETVEAVFDDIGKHNAAFQNLTFESLGEGGMMLVDVPEPSYRKVQTPNPLPAY